MSEALKRRILSQVQDDLVQIEAALAENLDPYLDLVSEVAGYILFAGGKRLRPLLTVLSARLCGYQAEHLIKMSTIFEYLHAATLLHDDLVDGSGMRRGKQAAHQLWDNATVVLVGDFLLARSLTLAAESRSPRVIDVIARITENMSQGEIQQLQRKGALDVTEAEYCDVIRRKTAVLFQGACRVSAILAGAGREKETALDAYGLHLGMAFQMADDLLDYTVDNAALGKPSGSDLREGKLTLPVIHTLSRAAAEDLGRIRQIIARPDFETAEFLELIRLMERYGGIEYTRQRAGEHIQRACAALAVFDSGPAREVLADIARYALTRQA
ncbi:MAG TPA: polyprenyl synthetase family protein [Desulfobacterales bacterium]